MKSSASVPLGVYVQFISIAWFTFIEYELCDGVTDILCAFTVTGTFLVNVPSNDFIIKFVFPAFNPLILFQYTLKILGFSAVHEKSSASVPLGEYVQDMLIDWFTVIEYELCDGVAVWFFLTVIGIFFV